MTRPKILMARAIFPDIAEQAARHFDIIDNQQDEVLDREHLLALLSSVDGVIATTSEKIDAAMLAQCPTLKAICIQAVGYNNVDVAAATQLGVMVTNTPDVLNEATADFAWALLTATARRIGESERWLRQGLWQKWRYDLFLGADLHRSTLGIIGMGRIGQAIARRSLGFEMQVLYHNRSRLPADLEARANNARFVSKEQLLQQSDHVLLMLPYSAQTHHTIGAAELALMKQTANLINVARGGIVDDNALIDALTSGKIAAAGLDVFENEPRLATEFLALPNVVLTPHMGSATESTRRGMAQRALDNLKAALLPETAPPRDLVNPEVLQNAVARRRYEPAGERNG